MPVGFAAIAAIGGLASTALTTGFSINDLIKSKRLQKEADAEAQKAMAEAKKLLDVNVYEALNVQMKPYELEREAALTTGAQLIEAGRESERGAAAAAGRIQANQQALNRDIQTRMGKEMADLQKLTAAEESRLRDVKTQLYLDEVEGAQQASAMYDERAAQAAKGAILGVTSMIGQAAKLPALYGTNVAAEQAGFANLNLNADQLKALGNIDNAAFGTAEAAPQPTGMGPFNANEGMFVPTAVSNFDPQMISQLTPTQYLKLMESLPPEQAAAIDRIIFQDPKFKKAYDAKIQQQSNFFGNPF
jgi:hypothetical protein